MVIYTTFDALPAQFRREFEIVYLRKNISGYNFANEISSLFRKYFSFGYMQKYPNLYEYLKIHDFNYQDMLEILFAVFNFNIIRRMSKSMVTDVTVCYDNTRTIFAFMAHKIVNSSKRVCFLGENVSNECFIDLDRLLFNCRAIIYLIKHRKYRLHNIILNIYSDSCNITPMPLRMHKYMMRNRLNQQVVYYQYDENDDLLRATARMISPKNFRRFALRPVWQYINFIDNKKIHHNINRLVKRINVHLV